MISELAGALLDDRATKDELDRAAGELHELLASIAPFHGNELVQLPSGTAIAPADAARCTTDGLRTAMFLRGVRAAIGEAQRRFPGQRIEIVYAGTGPYAPLAIPLMPLLSPDDARFTLIDVHRSAADSVRALIERFGFAPLVRAVIAGDAAAYEHPPDVPLHVVITETMQRALTVEPQVAIVRRLAARLHERGLLVPERVSVDLALQPGASIGRAVELTLATARDAAYWSEPRVLRLDGATPSAQAVLRTTITTFGPHTLGEYDSGLTHPEVLWDLTNLIDGEEIECWYDGGARPRVRVARKNLPTSPADGLLREAIQTALRADPRARGELFAWLLDGIEAYMKQRPEERPWTYTAFVGTDGSRIFRGAVGRSIVIDPAGAMWRARSYEDFDTAYEIANNECRIVALTPIYETMQRYAPMAAPSHSPPA